MEQHDWPSKPEGAPVYDDAFWVKKQRFGTYVSVGKDGRDIITSLHEQLCIDSTRFYLKYKQEN